MSKLRIASVRTAKIAEQNLNFTQKVLLSILPVWSITCRSISSLGISTTADSDQCVEAYCAIMEEVDKLAAETTPTQRQIWLAIVDKYYMQEGPPVRGVAKRNS